jgi:microcystin-dependent protein
MPYLGEIKIWPVRFVPEGWLACDGRLLKVQEHQALFSIIENMYGGDGRKDFALPDLRGVFPIGSGTGSSGTRYLMGTRGNDETQRVVNHVTFDVPLPEHTHKAEFTWENAPSDPVQVVVNNAANSSASPGGNYLAVASGSGNPKVYGAKPTANPPATLAGVSGGTGGGIKSGTVTVSKEGIPNAKAAVDVTSTFKMLPPYLTLGFIICVEGGDYPPRREDDSMMP